MTKVFFVACSVDKSNEMPDFEITNISSFYGKRNVKFKRFFIKKIDSSYHNENGAVFEI